MNWIIFTIYRAGWNKVAKIFRQNLHDFIRRAENLRANDGNMLTARSATWYLSVLGSYLLGLVSRPWSCNVVSSSLLSPNTEHFCKQSVTTVQRSGGRHVSNVWQYILEEWRYLYLTRRKYWSAATFSDFWWENTQRESITVAAYSEHRLHVWPEGKGVDLGVVVSHHLPAHVPHHADDGVRGEAGLGRVPALRAALLRRRHREREGYCEL